MLWTDERINEVQRNGDMFQDRGIAVSYMATALHEMRDEYEVERQALSVELSAKDVEIARLMDSLEQTRTYIKRQDEKILQLEQDRHQMRDEYEVKIAALKDERKALGKYIESLEQLFDAAN